MSWPGPCGDGALEFLIDLGRRHDLDGWVLFAGSDEDLRFVAQNHSALAAVFTLTTPPWDKVRWAYDKRLHERPRRRTRHCASADVLSGHAR